MRRGWIVNVLLLAVVAGLGFYVFYRPAEEAPQHKLTTLVPSAVSQVAIEARGGQPIELAKRGDAWYLVRPFQARADRSQVERLLELTSAASKEKLAATELARFDLDRPALTVTLGEQRFAFGTVNPLNQEQYVLAGDGVYLVPAFYASLVPQDAQRLLTHALFVEGESPVAFVLPGLRIELQGAKWVRLPPGPRGEPSQDDFNRWVDEWRFASSLLTQRAGTAAAEHIQVRLADGRTLKLGLLQKQPELILVRPDEKLQFHFSGEMARRLLTPPEASAMAAGDAAASGVPAQQR